MQKFKMDDSWFGPLMPFIKDEDVTDINWNGEFLVIDNLVKGRYAVSDVDITDDFIQIFTTRIGNATGESFNRYNPLLETEIDELRISILHEDVCETGRSISIRKSPKKIRLTEESILADNYCSPEVLTFLKNCIVGHMNIIIAGSTGSGKTELLKFLTRFIPAMERAITIEDTLEIHYRDINPGKDCISIEINEKFGYVDAIKAALRQFPTWILLSEARSIEIQYLIQSLSTGGHCITTLHTDDVRRIPERMKNMVTDPIASNLIEKYAYQYGDLGILIKKEQLPNGRIIRKIDQVAAYDFENEIKSTTMIVEDGKLIQKLLPDKFYKKLNANPFEKEGI